MLKENIEMIRAVRNTVMHHLERNYYPSNDVIEAANFVLRYDLIEEEYKKSE